MLGSVIILFMMKTTTVSSIIAIMVVLYQGLRWLLFLAVFDIVDVHDRVFVSVIGQVIH